MGEWRSVTLGEVCDRPQYGAIARGGDEYAGPPFVRQTDIVSGRVDWASVPRCDLAVAEVPKYAIHTGDILVSRLGAGIGNAAVVREPNGAVFAGYLVRFKPRAELVDARYLGYHLQSDAWRDHVRGFGSGAAQPTLNAQQMGAYEFALPSCGEQRAIAHILGTLDDKIALNRRTSETLEAMARALFKSWFVDFDPVRAKARGEKPAGMDDATAKLFPSELVDSELGPVPKGWRVTALKELTSKIGSGATPRGGDKAYVESGLWFIRSQNVYDSAFTWDGIVRISEEEARRLAGVTVYRDDVLLNITGASILRTCVVDPDALPARVNQHVAIVRAREGVPPRFVHQWLLLPRTKSYLLGLDAGASRQAVTKGHIESVPVLAPSFEVLAQWASATDPLFARIDALHSESRSLARTRDALLPKLLSGELHVPAA